MNEPADDSRRIATVKRAATCSENVDPLAVERQRRDYESLFASNVVVSRRAPLQRSDARQPASKAGRI